ncbi:hypothetical protein J31TS6_48840 [Brevibacillus reuszeri]|uniref:CotS family spore coat protein n=1 Tax=Brevibacillus reuszeri TaxID=54915 RepID=UPI001AFD5BBF|nr:CotS family spore coat protein [Brevibacillus reuszeri]GIO08856.1 hypothetical protein J31TS6_48840 [Brevibacillus reuszeri]
MDQYLVKPWLVRGGNEAVSADWDVSVPPEIDELAKRVMGYYDMYVSERVLITSKPDKGGAIWRIETDKGSRSLKLLHRSPERSLFSVGFQEYIVNQGARVPRLIPAKDGKLFSEMGGKLWIVTDWISLQPATKVDLIGAQELCYGLGEFHRHSKGYVPPANAKNSSRLFRWPAYYQKIAKKIGWMRDMAVAYEDAIASRSILAVVDQYQQQALDALAKLNESAYANMVAMGEPYWGLVHQDYGWSNGQNGPGGLWVIDLDGVAYDLPFRDLRKLITSTMDDMGVWDVSWMRGMIEAYHQANPLDVESYDLLLIDMAMPNEFYKHLKEMFFDPVQFLNTEAEGILQRVVATDQSKSQALAELAQDRSRYESGNYESVQEARLTQPAASERVMEAGNWQLQSQGSETVAWEAGIIEEESGEFEMALPEEVAFEEETVETEKAIPEVVAFEEEAVEFDIALPEEVVFEEEAVETEKAIPEVVAFEEEAVEFDIALPEEVAFEEETVETEKAIPEVVAFEEEAVEFDIALPEEVVFEEEAVETEKAIPEVVAFEEEAVEFDIALPEEVVFEEEAVETEKAIPEVVVFEEQVVEFDIALPEEVIFKDEAVETAKAIPEVVAFEEKAVEFDIALPEVVAFEAEAPFDSSLAKKEEVSSLEAPARSYIVQPLEKTIQKSPVFSSMVPSSPPKRTESTDVRPITSIEEQTDNQQLQIVSISKKSGKSRTFSVRFEDDSVKPKQKKTAKEETIKHAQLKPVQVEENPVKVKPKTTSQDEKSAVAKEKVESAEGKSEKTPKKSKEKAKTISIVKEKKSTKTRKNVDAESKPVVKRAKVEDRSQEINESVLESNESTPEQQTSTTRSEQRKSNSKKTAQPSSGLQKKNTSNKQKTVRKRGTPAKRKKVVHPKRSPITTNNPILKVSPQQTSNVKARKQEPAKQARPANKLGKKQAAASKKQAFSKVPAPVQRTKKRQPEKLRARKGKKIA